MTLDHGKRLLYKARIHFEKSTGLQTKTVRLKLMGENWWEAHIEEASNAIATSRNYPKEHVICLREIKMQERSDAYILTDLLHELAHEFEPNHGKKFYRLLKRCRVEVGGYYDPEYRIETPSKTIEDLVR